MRLINCAVPLYKLNYFLYRSITAKTAIGIAVCANLTIKEGVVSELALLSSYISFSNYSKASFPPSINSILLEKLLDLLDFPLYLNSAIITLPPQ